MTSQFVLIIFLHGDMMGPFPYGSLIDCNQSLALALRIAESQFHGFCVDTKEMKIGNEFNWKPPGGK